MQDQAPEVMRVTTAKERDVVDLLVDQHNQIKSLFSEVMNAQGAQKRDRFEDLVRLLAVHETAEEEIVHPTARKKIDSGEQVVDSRLREEEAAKKALADLYDLGVDHPDFPGRLAALANDVTEHATREENDEFTPLRQRASVDQLRRMADAVKAAEATAPTRPHPATGESAAANLVAGPPVAIFDRVRDSVRDWRRSHGGND